MILSKAWWNLNSDYLWLWDSDHISRHFCHIACFVFQVTVFTLPEDLRKLVLITEILHSLSPLFVQIFNISYLWVFISLCYPLKRQHTRFWVFPPLAALVWLEWLKVLILPGYSYYPEPLWRVREPQDALHAGHLSINGSEGEALQERREEQEELHSGQRLP